MYFDPNMGSMIIQILVAGMAGIGTVLFILRNKIRAIFGKNKKNMPPEEETVDTDLTEEEQDSDE